MIIYLLNILRVRLKESIQFKYSFEKDGICKVYGTGARVKHTSRVSIVKKKFSISFQYTSEWGQRDSAGCPRL